MVSKAIDAASTAIAGKAMPTGANAATTPPAPASTAKPASVTRLAGARRQLISQHTHAAAVVTSHGTGTGREPSERCSRATTQTSATRPITRSAAMPPANPLRRAARSRETGPMALMLPPEPLSRALQPLTP